MVVRYLFGPDDLLRTRFAIAPLMDLIGQRRARILRALDRPASILVLAQRMRVSTGGVSDHLHVLRQAGLVTAHREGRYVIYTRTAKGDNLSWS